MEKATFTSKPEDSGSRKKVAIYSCLQINTTKDRQGKKDNIKCVLKTEQKYKRKTKRSVELQMKRIALY